VWPRPKKQIYAWRWWRALKTVFLGFI